MRALRSFGRSDPEARARLEAAVAAIDRELAANLELASMFDQTHQAVVLENGEFARHRLTLERELGETFELVADLYARIPDAESAMERRGPANSLKEEDRGLVESWEGDARALQWSLHDALAGGRRSPLLRLIDRIRGRSSVR